MFKTNPSFNDHKLVTARSDRASGLEAIIAVHDDTRGPAIGGCRIYPYPSTADALTDVLRLSRGMTYKTAIADIPYGGGKAVIIADPARDKTVAMLHAMGEFVESLGGLYITSFDSGTSLDDVRTIATQTSHASGISEEAFDASESTADGVFACLRAAAEMKLGARELSGLTVAVQGAGSVGSKLIKRLRGEGAAFVVADKDQALAERVAAEFGGRVVPIAEIHRIDAEIFSPNALGGILNEVSIPEIKAKVVVGGANNQLAVPADDRRLLDAEILYCPDYLVNAGGIINLHYQESTWDVDALCAHVARLADTLREVVSRAGYSRKPPGEVADLVAEERIANARKAA